MPPQQPQQPTPPLPVQPPYPAEQPGVVMPQQSSQPPVAPAPLSANYDFIMNPAQPTKHTAFGASSSLPMRLLLIVGALFLLVVVGAVLLKAVAGGNAGGLNKAAMLSVLQDQVEIQHIASTGIQNSVSTTNKNFSVTAALSLKSDQVALTTYLSSKGYKPNAKLLTAKQSATIDTELTNAQSSSTFDAAYTTAMQQELLTYRADLSTAYKGAGKSAKTMLSQQYNNSSLLITQLTGQAADN